MLILPDFYFYYDRLVFSISGICSVIRIVVFPLLVETKPGKYFSASGNLGQDYHSIQH